MWPLLLTLGLIGAGLGRWLWSQNGRDVLALCRRHPVVFAPAAGVWAICAIVHAIDSPALKSPFLNVSGSGIVLAISVGLVISMVAHVVALAGVLHLCFRRILGNQPRDFRVLLLVTLLVMGAAWVALFALLVPFSPMFKVSGLAWVALGVLALLYVAINLIGAALMSHWPSTVVEIPNRVREVVSWLRGGAYRRLLPIVALHCAVIGVVTLVWLDGYTVVKTTPTGGMSWSTETTSWDRFDLTVHAKSVLALTVSNPWPTEVAQGLEKKLDAPLREALALLTALLSTLFLIAYARPVPAPGVAAGLSDR